MMKTIHAATLGAALLVAAPLAAQHQHQHGAAPARPAAAAHQGGHMHPPAVRELSHKADLALSAQQVSRLEAIQARVKAMCAEHGPHLMQGMGEMRTLVAGADSVAFRTVAARQSAMMLEMQMTMHRAYRDARAVLSAEQARKLDGIHAAHQAAGGEHAAHGAQAAGGAHAGHGATAAAGAHAGHGAQAAAGGHGAGHAGMECSGMPCCGMPCCEGMKGEHGAGAQHD